MIHQSKDQGNIPTLVGQPLEAAEVWDSFIKPVRIKVRLRTHHSPPTAFNVRQKLGTQEYWPLLSANSMALMRASGEPQSRGIGGVGSHHSLASKSLQINSFLLSEPRTKVEDRLPKKASTMEPRMGNLGLPRHQPAMWP